MTPVVDPKFHEDAKMTRYAYSDRNSSVKLYSTNVVETVKSWPTVTVQKRRRI